MPQNKTDLQILNKIVEDAQALRVFTFLDVNEGPYFRCLATSGKSVLTVTHMCSSYLECNMIIADTNFQFLLPNNVLLGPVGIVFPVRHQISGKKMFCMQDKKAYLVISLDSTILFSSFTTRGPIHTLRSE